MSWFGIAAGGAAKAGMEHIKMMGEADLQAQRDARLAEYTAKRDQATAEREAQRDERTATREDARWKAQDERETKRLSTQTAIAEQRDRLERDRLAQRDAADQRRHEQLMGRIAASGSRGGRDDDDDGKGASREFNNMLKLAKELREAGDEQGAQQVLARLRTAGKPPPVMPQRDDQAGGPDRPSMGGGARPQAAAPRAAAAPSPAMVTDPDSPAGKWQARRQAAPAAASVVEDNPQFVWDAESLSPLELARKYSGKESTLSSAQIKLLRAAEKKL